MGMTIRATMGQHWSVKFLFSALFLRFHCAKVMSCTNLEDLEKALSTMRNIPVCGRDSA